MEHTPEEIRKAAKDIVEGLHESYPSLTADFMEKKVQALLAGTPARSLGIMGGWAEKTLQEIGWLEKASEPS